MQHEGVQVSGSAKTSRGVATVAEGVRAVLGDFSASERKVARSLLAAYPVAGLETVAQLAERAGVSPPTVVRFVSRLGFTGYPAFQQALMREVHERMGSPLEQFAEKQGALADQELLPYAASTFIDTLAHTFDELPEAEFTKAVDAICDRRNRMWLLGGQFSRVVAAYFAAHLRLLRTGVLEVDPAYDMRSTLVADADKNTVLIVFDYRRYDIDVVAFARLIAARGGTVVLLTDPWLSPAAEFAEIVLPARVEAPSPFDSLVPAMAVVEALVAAVTEKVGIAGKERLELFESARERLRAASTGKLDGTFIP